MIRNIYEVFSAKKFCFDSILLMLRFYNHWETCKSVMIIHLNPNHDDKEGQGDYDVIKYTFFLQWDRSPGRAVSTWNYILKFSG